MSAEYVAARAGLGAVKPGLRVETLGLRQDWTVLALTVLEPMDWPEPTGIMLAVRENPFNPYVIELVRMSGGDLTAWQGTYHHTLAEAVRDYRARGGRIDGLPL